MPTSPIFTNTFPAYSVTVCCVGYYTRRLPLLLPLSTIVVHINNDTFKRSPHRPKRNESLGSWKVNRISRLYTDETRDFGRTVLMAGLFSPKNKAHDLPDYKVRKREMKTLLAPMGRCFKCVWSMGNLWWIPLGKWELWINSQKWQVGPMVWALLIAMDSHPISQWTMRALKGVLLDWYRSRSRICHQPLPLRGSIRSILNVYPQALVSSCFTFFVPVSHVS